MLQEIYTVFKQTQSISTDTRAIKPDSIFFALKGENFDGNQFVHQAFEAGCKYAVVSKPEAVINSRCFLVDDTLAALQELAKLYRQSLTIPFIGITGSNGKTTTKELIVATLSAKYKVAYTKGNLNNHIGVPLTILDIKDSDEIAVIEMGANHQGEIAFLSSIADPDYGIITNIGKAHLEGFGGYEGVKKAKRELYEHIALKKGKLFVNSDNELLMSFSENINRITFGKKQGFCTAKILDNSPFLKIEFIYNNQSYEISTHLVGDYNFENVLAAVTIGLFFGCEPQQIIQQIENYIPSNNRSQQIKTARNVLIMDAYNANPSSLTAAISNFAKMPSNEKMLIIGDMLELGEEAPAEHQAIIDLIKKLGIVETYFVGPVFLSLAEKNGIRAFTTSDELAAFLEKNPINNKTILIKGSRGIKLEKVLPQL